MQGPTKKFPSKGFRRSYRSNNHKQAGSKSDSVEIRKTRPLRCYICDSPEHLARNCRQKNTEASGKLTTTQSKLQKTTSSKVIRTVSCPSKNQNGIRCVKVLIEGVHVTGLVDMGSDITIIRGDLFYKIASVAKMDINSIKNFDQKVCTYDQKPITLGGCIDMRITFGEKHCYYCLY